MIIEDMEAYVNSKREKEASLSIFGRADLFIDFMDKFNRYTRLAYCGIKRDDALEAMLLIKKEKLIKLLKKINLKDILIAIKLIIAQLNILRTASHKIDAIFIDKNLLLQNTYYKTITSRP